MLPPRRKFKGHYSTREADGRLRCAAHLQWLRGFQCSVSDCQHMDTGIHAHHVRENTGAGTGLKPGDDWAVPLCGHHHSQLHNIGARSFEADTGVNLRTLAAEFASKSPALARHRRKQT